jgi:hypothetical protein
MRPHRDRPTPEYAGAVGRYGVDAVLDRVVAVQPQSMSTDAASTRDRPTPEYAGTVGQYGVNAVLDRVLTVQPQSMSTDAASTRDQPTPGYAGAGRPIWCRRGPRPRSNCATPIDVNRCGLNERPGYPPPCVVDAVRDRAGTMQPDPF